MKNLLFVSYYFNEKTASSSVRVRSFAQNLPKFGWYPIVITPNLNKNTENKVEYSKLYEIHETDYEYMLDKWKRVFNLNNESKEEKKIFDNHKPISKKSTSFSLENKYLNSIKKNMIHYMGEFFAYPDGMKYWFEPAMDKIDEIIDEKEIDAIFTASWPVTSHKIGHEVKKKYNIPWIASLHDLWSQNPYIKHIFLRTYFEKRLELKTLSNADVLITTSDKSSEKLKELHENKRVETILTGFENKISSQYKTSKNSDNSNVLRILYAGSLYTGKRDPRTLFKASQELINQGKIDSKRISYEFYGDPLELDKISKEFNLNKVIKNYGKIPRDELLKKQNEADLLLILSWNNPSESLVIPGKIYEYLAANKPILSIGYPECGLKDIIEYTNTGKHLSDYYEIKSELERTYNEFINQGYLNFNGNYDKIKEFSQENTSKKLGNILDSLVK